MATVDEQLKSFTQFVQNNHDRDLQLQELFDLWMLENATDADYAENVAAVNASINDYLNGERGTLAGGHSQQLREEFGLSEE